MQWVFFTNVGTHICNKINKREVLSMILVVCLWCSVIFHIFTSTSTANISAIFKHIMLPKVGNESYCIISFMYGVIWNLVAHEIYCCTKPNLYQTLFFEIIYTGMKIGSRWVRLIFFNGKFFTFTKNCSRVWGGFNKLWLPKFA